MSVTNLAQPPPRLTRSARSDRSAAPGPGWPARPQDAVDVPAGRGAQARPAHAVQEPGHVHRRGRRGVHHRPRDRRSRARSPGSIVVWLWLTVVFANLAEAVAEGRGKAQADALRAPRPTPWPAGCADGQFTAPRNSVPRPNCSRATGSSCEAGDFIPGDGDVVEGIASVDESAITGESAPVIRESGGDRSLGHRRHQGAVGPHRRRDHPEAGRELHRPDDRPGRGREPAEDPERDRAQHPARLA